MVTTSAYQRALLPSPTRERTTTNNNEQPPPPTRSTTRQTSSKSLPLHTNHRTPTRRPTTTRTTTTRSKSVARRKKAPGSSVFDRLQAATTYSSNHWKATKHVTPRVISPPPIRKSPRRRRQASVQRYSAPVVRRTSQQQQQTRPQTHQVRRAQPRPQRLSHRAISDPTQPRHTETNRSRSKSQGRKAPPNTHNLQQRLQRPRQQQHQPSSVAVDQCNCVESCNCCSHAPRKLNPTTPTKVLLQRLAEMASPQKTPNTTTRQTTDNDDSVLFSTGDHTISTALSTLESENDGRLSTTPAPPASLFPYSNVVTPSSSDQRPLQTTNGTCLLSDGPNRLLYGDSDDTDDTLLHTLTISTTALSTLESENYRRLYTIPASPVSPSHSRNGTCGSGSYGPWGKNFMNQQGVGIWSFHFLQPESGSGGNSPGGGMRGVYISFEHPSCAGEKLKNGTPLPKRLPFLRYSYYDGVTHVGQCEECTDDQEQNVTGGGKERTFRGVIDFVDMFDSTWGEYRTFQCEMTFDSMFTCVLSGKEVWKKDSTNTDGVAVVRDSNGSPEKNSTSIRWGRQELKQTYGEGSHIYLNAALTERFAEEEESMVLTERLREEGATDETVELVKLVMMGKNPASSP